MKRRYTSTASSAGADRRGVSPRSANEGRCDVNTAPADEDPNTTPLPVLSQFFTWAPGDEPAPYDPPRTSTETRRPQGPSSHPVIDVVPRPQAAHQPGHRRWWLVAVSVVAVVVTAGVVFWPERSISDQPSPSATVPVPARIDPRLASLMPADYPAGPARRFPPTIAAPLSVARTPAPRTPQHDSPSTTTSMPWTPHSPSSSVAQQFWSVQETISRRARGAAVQRPTRPSALWCVAPAHRAMPASAGPSTASYCLPALNPAQAAPRCPSSTIGGPSTPDADSPAKRVSPACGQRPNLLLHHSLAGCGHLGVVNEGAPQIPHPLGVHLPRCLHSGVQHRRHMHWKVHNP